MIFAILLAGCAKPGAQIDQMVCLPDASPLKPSSDYAGLSIATLEDRARENFWGKSDKAAARALGERYEREGVARDFTKAAEWYGAAAIVPPASRAVYVPGVRGGGGSVLTGWRRGAGGRLHRALYRLGALYDAGLGVKQDRARAQILLACAAQRGVPNG